MLWEFIQYKKKPIRNFFSSCEFVFLTKKGVFQKFREIIDFIHKILKKKFVKIFDINFITVTFLGILLCFTLLKKD